MRDLELAQYDKRRVYFGLSGRLADRSILQVDLKYAALKDRLLHDKTVAEEMSSVGAFTTVTGVQRLIMESEYPAAVIEEYENKEEVEKLLARYPKWKPAILYFSFNPKLQDKYPVLTPKMAYDFMRKHKIGMCVFAMTDHETDNFISKYPATNVARHLSARTQVEEDIKKFLSPLVSNVSDCPVMFHYLTPERLSELKRNFGQNKQMLGMYDLTPRERKEAVLFMDYMIGCLDGRNVAHEMQTVNVSHKINQNTVEFNQRPSFFVEQAKSDAKTSDKDQKKNLLTKTIGLYDEICRGANCPETEKSIQIVSQAMQEMRSLIPAMKQLSRRSRKKVYPHVMKTIDVLTHIGATEHKDDRFIALCRTGAETLKWDAMSNGERAAYLAEVKESRRIAQTQEERRMMASAERREAKKREERLIQMRNNARKVAEMSPQEKAVRQAEKEQRRMMAKERKALKAATTVKLQDKKQAYQEMLSQVKPIETMKQPTLPPAEILTKQDAISEKNVVYIIGHAYIKEDEEKTDASALTDACKKIMVPFHQKAIKDDFSRVPRKVVCKKTFVNSSFIGSVNTRSRGRS